MIENQEDLRTALEKNRKQKAQIKLLEAAQQEPEDSASETAAQREQLQTLVRFSLMLLHQNRDMEYTSFSTC